MHRTGIRMAHRPARPSVQAEGLPFARWYPGHGRGHFGANPGGRVAIADPSAPGVQAPMIARPILSRRRFQRQLNRPGLTLRSTPDTAP